jgi:hypothetical protein
MKRVKFNGGLTADLADLMEQNNVVVNCINSNIYVADDDMAHKLLDIAPYADIELSDMDIYHTTCKDIFNALGVLHDCGEYSGEYQKEAFNLMGLQDETEGDEWADIMANDKGEQFAIHAFGEFTGDGDCYYMKLDDCDKVDDCQAE